MDYKVSNMQELKQAFESSHQNVNIEITAPFAINETLFATNSNFTIFAKPTEQLTLSRADDFMEDLFVVSDKNFVIKNLCLDGNASKTGVTEGSLIRQTGGLVSIEKSLISNNFTSANGGAIQSFGGKLEIIDTELYHNCASENGGAIYSEGEILLKGKTTLDANTATNGNGGAIWIDKLDMLFAEHDVVFSNNLARQGYFMTDPSDIALHQNQILAIVFTNPFIYAYNNFDVVYTSGTPFIENGCTVKASREMEVCMPVAVTPFAKVGVIKVKCCEKPTFEDGLTCGKTKNTNCNFTIKQKVCVELPVEFGAKVTPGDANVECGKASSADEGCKDCGISISESEVRNE